MSQNGLIAVKNFIEIHRNQLETSAVPEIYWETLFKKLSEGIFDAGATFQLLRVENEEDESLQWRVEVNSENGIDLDDPCHIYLVDHAWTFRPSQARQNLDQIPGLVERMASLMDVTDDPDSMDRREMIDAVSEAKWRFAQTYSVQSAGTVEDRMPIWYIVDEFGARIQHSDDPSFRMVPFISMLDGCAYSVLFPIKRCENEDEVTRDYVEGPEAQDPMNRKALLNAWERIDMTDIPWKQTEPPKEFFESSRENESLPDLTQTFIGLPKDRKIKVYAEYDVIVRNLHHPRFELVETQAEADVLWLMGHFKDYKSFSENHNGRMVNQFPFENVITIKDLLCVVCRRMAKDGGGDAIEETLPAWLPTTFNMKTELAKFVSYFQGREKQSLDNHWIIKPWNLARGLDMQIASNLSHILRLPFSGPKIAQKYLHDPVLFSRPEIGRVKFDIRYILLLQSVEPLRVYAYNRFWLRFANRSFDLTELDVYEKHFTVMNYNEAHLEQKFCTDFIREFEDQYPDFQWKDVEHDIFTMFKEVFTASTKLPPPCGIGHNPQSRAMYASDLMLEWRLDPATGKRKMQPKILEINWGPDCTRACDYYPEFFDNVFSTLFLNEDEGQNVTLL